MAQDLQEDGGDPVRKGTHQVSLPEIADAFHFMKVLTTLCQTNTEPERGPFVDCYPL